MMKNLLTYCGKDLTMLNDDYTELDLYLEQNQTVDLWVYTEPNKLFVVKDVIANPVRLHGWWSIRFIQYNRYASVHVEDAKVMYFVTLDKERVDG